METDEVGVTSLQKFLNHCVSRELVKAVFLQLIAIIKRENSNLRYLLIAELLKALRFVCIFVVSLKDGLHRSVTNTAYFS